MRLERQAELHGEEVSLYGFGEGTAAPPAPTA
jgi:hypothetical protein